jgi:hypothetical protein
VATERGTKTVAIGVPRASCEAFRFSRPETVAKQVEAGSQAQAGMLKRAD